MYLIIITQYRFCTIYCAYNVLKDLTHVHYDAEMAISGRSIYGLLVTCQRHAMYELNFFDYKRTVSQKNIYEKELFVNFTCLNKEFVTVIVIVASLCS